MESSGRAELSFFTLLTDWVKRCEGTLILAGGRACVMRAQYKKVPSHSSRERQQPFPDYHLHPGVLEITMRISFVSFLKNYNFFLFS